MPVDKKDATTPFIDKSDQPDAASSEDSELTVDDIETDGENVKGGGVNANFSGFFSGDGSGTGD